MGNSKFVTPGWVKDKFSRAREEAEKKAGKPLEIKIVDAKPLGDKVNVVVAPSRGKQQTFAVTSETQAKSWGASLAKNFG